MSGHSKWATTKHKKAVVDAKRGKLFAKLIKNIEVAARTGGGDMAGNPTLSDAIPKAKDTSVPNDNIDRAVKRGSGVDAGGADYETIMYEGYGPGGVAVLIECLTDNRNRAASEVRTAITRNGGRWPIPAGVVPVQPQGRRDRAQGDGLAEDDVLGGGARCRRRGGQRPRRAVRGDLRGDRPARGAHRRSRRHRAIDSADVAFLPSVSVPLDDETGAQGLRLVDALEDCDDVQNVWANFDVSDEVMESV